METNNASNRKCNFCGEEMEGEWRRCPFCGSLSDARIEALTATVEPKQDENSIKDSSSFRSQDEHPQQKASEIKPFLNGTSNGTINTQSYPAAATHEHQPLKKTSDSGKSKSLLGNGFKVFLTVFCTIVPGLGQLIGLIAGLVFMNSDDESYGEDKRSFGLALIVASIIMFLLTCTLWFVILLALATPFNGQ